ncbi:MAG: hypothetical protein HUU55_04580 [Myxococcales bacterium]|nr:hypothetical protein [Myxococcales bacterium]
MKLLFRHLFALKITHEYYGGACPDFVWLVPEATAQLLRNGKLLAKIRDGHLFVLCQVDDSNSPVHAIVELLGTKLYFGLKLATPHFWNYTEWTESNYSPATHVLVYRNQQNLNSLDNHDVVEVFPPAEGKPTDDKLAIVSLWQQGALAVVEITVDEGFYHFSGIERLFVVNFLAKQEKLAYYVVANSANLENLAVVDAANANEGIGFESFTPSQIGYLTPAEQKKTTALVPPNTDNTWVLFRSNTKMRRTAHVRRGITLIKKKPTDAEHTDIIQHLPQPRADQIGSEMVVYLTKTSSS